MSSFTIADLRDAENDAWEAVDRHVAGILEGFAEDSSNTQILDNAYKRFYAMAIQGEGTTISDAHSVALMAVSIVTELCINAAEGRTP